MTIGKTSTIDRFSVFIIDDDEVDYRAVARLLADAKPAVELVWEPDPERALDRLRVESYDVILLDYRLGAIDGMELLTTLRQMRIETPIIMLTGMDDERLDRAALEAGADDYLVKGEFSKRELLRTLRYAKARNDSNHSLKLLKSALDHGPVGVAIATSESLPSEPGIIYANPMFQMITGRTMGDLRERPISVLFGPRTDPAQIAEFHRSQDAHRDFIEGMVLYREDRSTFQAHLRLGAFSEASSEQTHFVVVLRDMTEQYSREEQLRNQARMLSLAHDVIIAQDLEGRIIFCNQATASTLGADKADIVGRTMVEVASIKEDCLEDARRITLTAGSWVGELAVTDAKGRRVILQSRWSLVRDDHGEPVSILSISRDVTEQKELQERFNRTQRMEAIGSLAAGVAHDLNNVLAPIIMGVSLFDLEPNVPPSLRELRKTIENSAQRGAQIVKQLLSFARGGAKEMSLVQVRHLAKEVQSLARASFPPSIRIILDLPGDLWPVRANPTQIHQILLNLAVNARDAMPDGGTLTITGCNQNLTDTDARELNLHAGPYTTIRVQDTGTGVPPHLHEKIFELFYTTKPEGKGTGLGLATIKGIVDEYRGFIRLESDVGCGSSFIVGLPAEADPCNDRCGQSAEMLQGHGETVLVVDDEESIRTVVKRTLESNGYRALTAKNGVDGLNVFALHRDEIKLVLSDVLMPEMDGPTMVATLRRGVPDLKVVYATGAPSGGNTSFRRRTHHDFEGIECLAKPFLARDLLNKLHDVLHADRQTPAVELS